MHHLGKPAFYADVRRVVMAKKLQGYVVYYELIRPADGADSNSLDVLQRKMRKIMGTSRNYKQTMDSVGLFKSYILQPPYADMGIDSFDVNADVTLQQLVDEWERRQGVVSLDSVDYNIPLSATYMRKPLYNSKKWNRVALDYRNTSLVQTITACKQKKILILYGAAHYKGVKTDISILNKGLR